MKTGIVLAAVLGFTGVALGAFGAHGLSAYFAANPGREGTFETGLQYHLIHAAALLGAAWAAERYPHRFTRAAVWALFAGAVVFAGALYILALLQVRAFGAVAPVGGALMLAGWALLAAGVIRARP
jgi:uncharacterized membrane protein YgdD (TMEM256/DUF423 family)